MAGPSDGDPDGWVEFCERQAKTTAQDFAKAYLHFVQNNTTDTVSRPISQKEILKKFVECFSEQFDIEFGKLKAQNKIPNGTHTGHDESDYSEDTDSPKTHHKPFFRRLSFKGLRRGKGLFHKQHSDEVELSSNLNKQTKTKLAKIVVECRKEGLVNYLTPESLEQPGASQKWEKCRLALVKTVGGYMLEFYSPPKAQKPRSGVFCFLISEARETITLEMPDHENTFVLKADNNMEYVIEAADVDDMKSWLATIKYCMRTAPTSQPPPETLANLPEPAPPDLPPRRDLPASTSNANLNLETPEDGELSSIVEEGYEVDRQRQSMSDWPWFHGTLARSAAASCVLAGGAAAHGCYLVRQSETRRGEFVLTFNFQGRAKHLRMTLSEAGQCRVQHLWFPDVHDMLEHFRVHPIPLESGGTADVTLTEYVVCNDPARPQQLSVSHGSDVRMRRAELEALMAASGPPRDQRAVDNQYVLCAGRSTLERPAPFERPAPLERPAPAPAPPPAPAAPDVTDRPAE
ncbi:SH2B adapter protein 1 [Aricia agestis]|uniref:SH2B adapter protein 1 n=1 Tax=Aricia agestis TaxID=91739 RepID=UPI001C206A5D|nr:SH2B adapter protein 1 [Aricia agestis]